MHIKLIIIINDLFKFSKETKSNSITVLISAFNFHKALGMIRVRILSCTTLFSIWISLLENLKAVVMIALSSRCGYHCLMLSVTL